MTMDEMLKRELNKTYLIMESGETIYEEPYELQMIVRNSPEKILPLRVMRVDGAFQLYYDVSAKQTLLEYAKRQKLSKETLRRLFENLEELYREMREYLLDAECIVLDLQHIYMQERNFYFCYYPWEKNDALNALRMMLEELLEYLDYHDSKGVELAYHFYQNACKGNIQISELLKEHEEKPLIENVMCEEPLWDLEEREKKMLPEEKQSKPEKKEGKGFLYKFLRFFLKKQGEEAEAEAVEKTEEDCKDRFYEMQQWQEENPVAEEGSTILLEQTNVQSWKLRPLLESYDTFEMKDGRFVIGKKREAVDGCIERNTISRIHSCLFVREGRLFISDANSTNGTFVNGRELEPGEEAEIFSGDRILFADVGYECYNSL